jgi:N-acetylmuramoyl-L-alanine amidase
VGADPLEGESGAISPASADASAEDLVAPAENLPAWLRPVRDPGRPTMIGTGGIGPKRVGLQVGHWRNDEVPDELRQLRASGGGATGGGYVEMDVNLDLANRTATLLRARGVEVDVIPSTVPQDYQADAFVAIHVDGDEAGRQRGYKVARSGLSQIPDHDDSLVSWLKAEYGRLSDVPRDSDNRISRRMTYYYAFNNHRYWHAVGSGTPAAIIETGYMSSAADRAILIGAPDRPAVGLAAAIFAFLGMSADSRSGVQVMD